MAICIVTLRVMPGSVESDLKSIEEKVNREISDFYGDVGKIEEDPIAFGLKALKFIFTMDESCGSTDELEDKIREIPDVQSVEVTDVRRAIG